MTQEKMTLLLAQGPSVSPTLTYAKRLAGIPSARRYLHIGRGLKTFSLPLSATSLAFREHTLIAQLPLCRG